MEKYDYREAVKRDVKEEIECNYTEELESYIHGDLDRDVFIDILDEGMFICDRVTGNASGSYTFNAYQAEEYICHNLDLLSEALEYFGSDMDILKSGAESCDVTIRCYLIHGCIEEVVDEYEVITETYRTMETKELEIVVPGGYEIDKEKSTFEKIIFKKKNDVPRSWEEFCRNRGKNTFEAYYIDNLGNIRFTSSPGSFSPILLNSKEEAKAFLALMQLRQLRKAWIGNWKPDWQSLEYKYVIDVFKCHICISPYHHDSGCLSFPAEDMACEFMECFKDLLEKAKILL